jgi:hypothetical protein
MENDLGRSLVGGTLFTLVAVTIILLVYAGFS